MTDTKMRNLDTIQLNRQKLNFQLHPKPKKQFVCLYSRQYHAMHQYPPSISCNATTRERKAFEHVMCNQEFVQQEGLL